MTALWYDDAVPAFAEIVAELLGREALLDNLFLRDADGLLTFVVLQPALPDGKLQELSQRAAMMKPYVDQLPVATPDQLFDDHLRDPRAGILEWVDDPRFTGWVRMVERRIGGQDWLRGPSPVMERVPPVIAFASLKGGVGRSTALAVAAAHLAAHGHDVLVIDLDLEAPGLGSLLLPEENLPEFGTLDYFVENGLRPIEDEFLDQMLATSPLTSGRGRIDVAPATGRRCDQAPANVLGKLSRAYLEDLAPGQPPKSFLDQTQALIRSLSDYRRYQAILVDSRAGLNESTAASMLGLGAHVLLFGTGTPQTFRGYRYLLGFLGRYRGLSADPRLGEWRARLRMVHAKAPAKPEAWERFLDDAYELFAGTLYDEVDDGQADQELPFNFDRHAEEAPHKAWRILNDGNFSDFDPPNTPELLREDLYARTFGNLLTGIDGLIKVPHRP